MSVETDGIRPFLVAVIASGTVSQSLISAVTGKRLVLRSAFAVCDADSIGTYGKLNFNAGAPDIAELVALKGTQVLYDPASPPMKSYAVSQPLRITVTSVEGGTTGFADIGCWVYGTYEIEDS